MRTPHPAVQAQLDEIRSWLGSGEPLLLDPEWLSRMFAADAMSRREVEGFFFLFDEKQPLKYTMREGVAILPIRGALARKSVYRTTYGEIAEQVSKAADDRKVRGILLDVDSPGGVVSGVEEAAQAVARASAVKPVYALANDYMASAAYWVSSPASKIFSTKYGTTGSIGVVLMHMDYSKQNERIGVKPTFIVGGRKKVFGNPEEPLSDEARAALQTTVDHYYQMFTSAVAANRKMDVWNVIKTEAGVFLPEDAKSAGLVDDVMSFDECAGQLSAMGGSRMPETTSNEPEKKAQVVDIDDVREKAKAEAKREAAARSQEIEELCKLIQRPELAGELINSERTVAQVREHLIDLRAKEDERHKTIGSHGSGLDKPAGRSMADAMVAHLKSRGLEPRKDTLQPA